MQPTKNIKKKQKMDSSGIRGIIGVLTRLFGMSKRYKSVLLIGFIFLTFIFSSIYIIYRIALAPTVAPSSDTIMIRVIFGYCLRLGFFLFLVGKRLNMYFFNGAYNVDFFGDRVFYCWNINNR